MGQGLDALTHLVVGVGESELSACARIACPMPHAIERSVATPTMSARLPARNLPEPPTVTKVGGV